MNKFAFVAAGSIAVFFACKKDDAAHAARAETDSVAVSATSDSALVVDPTPEQIAKARKVGNKRCPVSGEKLGGMGSPVSVIYKGELVELCCRGCVKDFEKDPEGVLAKAKAGTAPAD